MSTRTKITNPYGVPTSDLIYDSLKDEARRMGARRERFGGPHRSETQGREFSRKPRSPEREQRERSKQERSPTPERFRSPRRSRSRDRASGPRQSGPRQSGPREERPRQSGPREQRGGPREDRPREDRPREQRGPKSNVPYQRDSERRESQRRPAEDEEEFEAKSKAVRIPQDDLRQIRKEISERFDGPFTIVEAVVDPIHDTSEYFASSKRVDKLFTFIGKKNPELIEKLEKIPNIVVIEDAFSYTPSDVKNPFVLFFYPYWLMSMDKKAAKNVYFKNIPLQSGTFDDILKIEQPDLFAFVIPENVVVPEEYGAKEEYELDKGKLVIIEPIKKKKPLSIYGKSTGKKDVMTPKEYDIAFEKFLISILTPIAKEETIAKIVNTKTLPMWKKAFTHETIDLNDNYEQLETIGDRVLELTFLKYLLRKFPDLTPQEITELKSKYMSKIYQGTTSRKLGFGDWIRVGDDISSISILEDVFESFFGALFEISDQVLGDGAGYVMALKFLALIFSDVEFDLSKSQGHPRSQIKEIFEMLKLDPEIQDITTSDKGTYVEISITKRTLDDFVKMDMMKPDSPLVIGVGFGPYKTNAVNLAYSNALEYLDGLKITRSWAEQQKGYLDFLVPELEVYLEDAFNRSEKEGLDRIFLRSSRSSAKAGNVVVQLVGEYYDEQKKKLQKKILVSGRYPDVPTGKMEVVKLYAEGQ